MAEDKHEKSKTERGRILRVEDTGSAGSSNWPRGWHQEGAAGIVSFLPGLHLELSGEEVQEVETWWDRARAQRVLPID